MVGTAGAMQYYQDVTPMEDGGSTSESDSRQWTLGTGSRWSVPRNQECWSLYRKGNKTLLSNAYWAQKWKSIFSEHTLILLSVLSSFAEDNQSWLKPLNPIRPGPFQLTRRPGGGVSHPPRENTLDSWYEYFFIYHTWDTYRVSLKNKCE